MIRSLCVIIMFTSHVVAGWAQNVEFNYNGRVNVQGEAYTGSGQFKIALTNEAGSETYWANDGVTLDGNEPTSAVLISITDGFFSIDIGDTDIAGMAPLEASIFNSEGDVYLRTWFSDGNSGFERLLPDRKVVNPSLLGIFNDGPGGHIYVDPENGSDNSSGLSASSAKRTIQAAWNTIPPIVRRDFTIKLLPGVYREQTILKGKMIVAEYKIRVQGDLADPSLARITGADAGNEAQAVRKYGFLVENQQNVSIESLTLNTFQNSAIRVHLSSNAEVSSCTLSQAQLHGIHVLRGSSIVVNHCDIGNTVLEPVAVLINSYADLRNSYFHDSNTISSVFNSTLIVNSCHLKNLTRGVYASRGGIIDFDPPNSTIENCPVGAYADANATISEANSYVNYINVPTHTQSGPGGPVFYN